jgi:Xaa-Pro aminopeptidase
VPESTDTLVAGDVIAIEPGQYIPGVAGMRYERNYLVTADGYETLSKLELQIEQPG